MGATRGITNMAIAHEIAVNSDFKLEKLQFPEHRSVHTKLSRPLCINPVLIVKCERKMLKIRLIGEIDFPNN